MNQYFLEAFSSRYEVKERDIGEYAKIDKSGMHFKIRSFQVGELGYLSLIEMKAMLGLMKMNTAVFTPVGVDMPLLSYDDIKAMGNEILLNELYDLRLNKEEAFEPLAFMKEKYAHLPDHDLGQHWYDPLKLPGSLAKKMKAKKAVDYRPLFEEFVNAYLEVLKDAKPCDRKAKQEVNHSYVKGLFDNGGPSTEQFCKLLGREKAEDLFGNYVFSTLAE